MTDIYHTTTLDPDATRALVALAILCAGTGLLLVEQALISRLLSRFGLRAGTPLL